MTPEDKLIFRIACALNVCEALRAALEKNGNAYSGVQVPNLTSITDVLHIPFDILLAQSDITSGVGFDGVRHEFNWKPTPEVLSMLKEMLTA